MDDHEVLDFENRGFVFRILTDYLDVQQACLKEIHAEMLRRHLHRLEQLSEGEEDVEVNHALKRVVEENEEEINGMNHSDAEEAFTPEPIVEEEEAEEAAEAAGSFSPELMHGDDREEAIDPEEDKKLLVLFISSYS